MNALRWVLGIGTAAFIVGWGALVTAGNSFRGSLGASRNPVWKGVVLIGCALLARETAFVASMGILYCAAWLLCYYHAVWRAAAPEGLRP